MSNACDSQLSSGIERRVDAAGRRHRVRADRVDLRDDRHRRAGLGRGQRGPLAGQAGADDQHVVGGHDPDSIWGTPWTLLGPVEGAWTACGYSFWRAMARAGRATSRDFDGKFSTTAPVGAVAASRRYSG